MSGRALSKTRSSLNGIPRSLIQIPQRVVFVENVAEAVLQRAVVRVFNRTRQEVHISIQPSLNVSSMLHVGIDDGRLAPKSDKMVDVSFRTSHSALYVETLYFTAVSLLTGETSCVPVFVVFQPSSTGYSPRFPFASVEELQTCLADSSSALCRLEGEHDLVSQGRAYPLLPSEVSLRTLGWPALQHRVSVSSPVLDLGFIPIGEARRKQFTVNSTMSDSMSFPVSIAWDFIVNDEDISAQRGEVSVHPDLAALPATRGLETKTEFLLLVRPRFASRYYSARVSGRIYAKLDSGIVPIGAISFQARFHTFDVGHALEPRLKLSSKCVSVAPCLPGEMKYAGLTLFNNSASDIVFDISPKDGIAEKSDEKSTVESDERSTEKVLSSEASKSEAEIKEQEVSESHSASADPMSNPAQEGTQESIPDQHHLIARGGKSVFRVFPTSGVVPAGGSINIVSQFRPSVAKSEAYSAEYVINVPCGNVDGAEYCKTFTVSGHCMQPSIEQVPSVLALPPCGLDAGVTMNTFTIRNTSHVNARVIVRLMQSTQQKEVHSPAQRKEGPAQRKEGSVFLIDGHSLEQVLELQPLGQSSIDIVFKPTLATSSPGRVHSGLVEVELVNGNEAVSKQSIELTARAVVPHVSISPEKIDLGHMTVTKKKGGHTDDLRNLCEYRANSVSRSFTVKNETRGAIKVRLGFAFEKGSNVDSIKLVDMNDSGKLKPCMDSAVSTCSIEPLGLASFHFVVDPRDDPLHPRTDFSAPSRVAITPYQVEEEWPVNDLDLPAPSGSRLPIGPTVSILYTTSVAKVSVDCVKIGSMSIANVCRSMEISRMNANLTHSAQANRICRAIMTAFFQKDFEHPLISHYSHVVDFGKSLLDYKTRVHFAMELVNNSTELGAEVRIFTAEDLRVKRSELPHWAAADSLLAAKLVSRDDSRGAKNDKPTASGRSTPASPTSALRSGPKKGIVSGDTEPLSPSGKRKSLDHYMKPYVGTPHASRNYYAMQYPVLSSDYEMVSSEYLDDHARIFHFSRGKQFRLGPKPQLGHGDSGIIPSSDAGDSSPGHREDAGNEPVPNSCRLTVTYFSTKAEKHAMTALICIGEDACIPLRLVGETLDLEVPALTFDNPVSRCVDFGQLPLSTLSYKSQVVALRNPSSVSVKWRVDMESLKREWDSLAYGFPLVRIEPMEGVLYKKHDDTEAYSASEILAATHRSVIRLNVQFAAVESRPYNIPIKILYGKISEEQVSSLSNDPTMSLPDVDYDQSISLQVIGEGAAEKVNNLGGLANNLGGLANNPGGLANNLGALVTTAARETGLALPSIPKTLLLPASVIPPSRGSTAITFDPPIASLLNLMTGAKRFVTMKNFSPIQAEYRFEPLRLTAYPRDIDPELQKLKLPMCSRIPDSCTPLVIGPANEPICFIKSLSGSIPSFGQSKVELFLPSRSNSGNGQELYSRDTRSMAEKMTLHFAEDLICNVVWRPQAALSGRPSSVLSMESKRDVPRPTGSATSSLTDAHKVDSPRTGSARTSAKFLEPAASASPRAHAATSPATRAADIPTSPVVVIEGIDRAIANAERRRSSSPTSPRSPIGGVSDSTRLLRKSVISNDTAGSPISSGQVADDEVEGGDVDSVFMDDTAHHEPAWSDNGPSSHPRASVIKRLTNSRFHHLMSTMQGHNYVVKNLNKTVALSDDLVGSDVSARKSVDDTNDPSKHASPKGSGLYGKPAVAKRSSNRRSKKSDSSTVGASVAQYERYFLRVEFTTQYSMIDVMNAHQAAADAKAEAEHIALCQNAGGRTGNSGDAHGQSEVLLVQDSLEAEKIKKMADETRQHKAKFMKRRSTMSFGGSESGDNPGLVHGKTLAFSS